ncbi:hypothetical protein D6745_01790 [Candidatus Woesearchaeota archaeon]|nr:MAG: hypothetical protein D6745_01790 [Candidatus Woesearchaeota archaeon]
MLTLVKKCIICDKPAEFSVKGSSAYYCVDCAKENFANLDLLQRVEEQAKKLKEAIKEQAE